MSVERPPTPKSSFKDQLLSALKDNDVNGVKELLASEDELQKFIADSDNCRELYNVGFSTNNENKMPHTRDLVQNLLDHLQKKTCGKSIEQGINEMNGGNKKQVDGDLLEAIKKVIRHLLLRYKVPELKTNPKSSTLLLGCTPKQKGAGEVILEGAGEVILGRCRELHWRSSYCKCYSEGSVRGGRRDRRV